MDTGMTFRMDSDVKARMYEICAQLGMTPAAAFNIFANAFVRENGIPFPVRLQPQTSILRERVIEEIERIVEGGGADYPEDVRVILGKANDIILIYRRTPK